jgi:hypothetical protein
MRHAANIRSVREGKRSKHATDTGNEESLANGWTHAMFDAASRLECAKPHPGCLFRRGNAASVAQEGATERGRHDGVKERGELAVTGKENLEKVATVPRCAGVISLAQNLLRLVGLGALADVTASRFLGEFSG